MVVLKIKEKHIFHSKTEPKFRSGDKLQKMVESPPPRTIILLPVELLSKLARGNFCDGSCFAEQQLCTTQREKRAPLRIKVSFALSQSFDSSCCAGTTWQLVGWVSLGYYFRRTALGGGTIKSVP